MTQSKIPERRKVDAAAFHSEIVPGNRPVLLKGLVEHWPAVKAGLASSKALCDYLVGFDKGSAFTVLLGAPAIKGYLFYNDAVTGLNFERRQEAFGSLLGHLLAHLDDPAPPAIAIQSTPIAEYLPGFAEANATDLVKTPPRIWIGNAITVAAHFDPQDNLACVVGGRRRFTLFPPDQISNLYIGPLEFSPGGAPVSMVDVRAPDFARNPRFREALAASQTADLEPGDAIYIPYMWWHHVQSLERFNVLVNYWWNDAMQGLGSPLDALLHGVLSIAALPGNQREAWRALFDNYVFRSSGDPAAHLPSESRGVLGEMTPELAQHMRAALQRALNRS